MQSRAFAFESFQVFSFFDLWFVLGDFQNFINFVVEFNSVQFNWWAILFFGTIFENWWNCIINRIFLRLFNFKIFSYFSYNINKVTGFFNKSSLESTESARSMILSCSHTKAWERENFPIWKPVHYWYRKYIFRLNIFYEISFLSIVK